MTPLHMAASWRKPAIVDALLKAGADPSVADINGMTPLHLACVFGCADSVELLHASGKVDINAEATNALGTLRPLDCMLECEDRNAIPIWHSLQKKGVDMSYTRTVQSHPLPYPTQRVGPFLAAIIAMHRLRETETELDIAKVRVLSICCSYSPLSEFGLP
jgi:ankyrin repeat protein